MQCTHQAGVATGRLRSLPACMAHRAGWLSAALAAVTRIVVASAVKPKDFGSCGDCVAAGYGWSVAKGKCGGFANTQCPDPAPDTAFAAPAPPRIDSKEIVSLVYDGEGKLGLSFQRGLEPPTIRKITKDTWATKSSLLHAGMRLYSIGDTGLMGRSYDFSLGFLRAQAATASPEQPLHLSFAPAVGIDNEKNYPQSLQAASGATAPPPHAADDVPVAGGEAGGFSNERAAALAHYTPCNGVECYASTLAKDLAPFIEMGGITRQIFEDTRTYNMGPAAEQAGGGGRMNHYQIIGGTLYGSMRCPSRSGRLSFHPRCEGIEHTLLELLKEDRARAKKKRRASSKAYIGPIPDCEFVINVQDKPQVAWGYDDNRAPGQGNCVGPDDKKKICSKTPLPLFSFSKPQAGQQSMVDDAAGVPVGGPFWDIMYPAWTFWGGGPFISTEPNGVGRWDLKTQSITAAGIDTPWDQKTPKAFFRGSRTTYQRDPLVKLTVSRPDLAHAHYTKNQAFRSELDTLGLGSQPEVAMEEHCKFKYLFNFKGMAASFRYKHLFLCNSLVFHVGNHTGGDFIEFFYEALKPWVHYVPVREDMADLDEKLTWARENDDVAKQIAQAGFEFITDNLRYDDVKAYWRKLLIDYSKLLTYTVTKAADTFEISTKNHKVVDKK